MKPVRFSLRFLFACVTVCAALAALLPFGITGYHDRWTCALCRSYRTDYIYMGHKWGSDIQETSCSCWYRDNIERSHDHVWVHGRASALRDLYGNRFGAIDRDPAGRTIWRLTPDEQISLYQHFPSSAEGKSVFLMLASPKSKANNQDFEVVNKMLKWKESGFDASWDDIPTTPQLEVPNNRFNRSRGPRGF